MAQSLLPGQALSGPAVAFPLAGTVGVPDVLGEIADQPGRRVIEGPAELP